MEYVSPEDFQKHEGIVRDRYIFGIIKNVINKVMFFKVKAEECLLYLEDITTYVSEDDKLGHIYLDNLSQKRKYLIMDYLDKKYHKE